MLQSGHMKDPYCEQQHLPDFATVGAVSELVRWCEAGVSSEDCGEAERERCLYAPSRSLQIKLLSLLIVTQPHLRYTLDIFFQVVPFMGDQF